MPLFRRIIVPCLLLIAGVGLTVYGARYHTIPVTEERTEELSVPVPSPFGPPIGMDGLPFPGGAPAPDGIPNQDGVPAPDGLPALDGFPPPDSPFPGGPPMAQGGFPPLPPAWQPPPMFAKVTRITFNTTDEPEPNLIRLASVGGVTLAESDEPAESSGSASAESVRSFYIKKTFSGEDGPALCPT